MSMKRYGVLAIVSTGQVQRAVKVAEPLTAGKKRTDHFVGDDGASVDEPG